VSGNALSERDLNYGNHGAYVRGRPKKTISAQQTEQIAKIVGEETIQSLLDFRKLSNPLDKLG
jgi:hypothetical protein